MNSRGIFNSFLLPCCLIICFLSCTSNAHAQEEITYTKNKWQSKASLISLKKQSIYSAMGNEFFLKRGDRQAQEKETWAIFGGQGGGLYLYRDSTFAYSKGQLIYGQDEINFMRVGRTPESWQFHSASDTLRLKTEVDQASGKKKCRLYRTIKTRIPSQNLSIDERVILMSLELENGSPKVMIVKDACSESPRWKGFQVLACFFSAHCLTRDQD